MRNKKPLTIIAVVLGALVLYCLMNHREGFATDQSAKDAANLRAAQNAAAQNPAYRSLLAAANSPYVTLPKYTSAQLANMKKQELQASKNIAAQYGNQIQAAPQVKGSPATNLIKSIPSNINIKTAGNRGVQIQR
jgi:hypothetical protein